ncbi:tail fiber domain-containing protein [Nostoc sp.]|uniref:tail fiber domain-containing protein n=1 Tax=Nostoc sp. TaxID=1180 RepID=UPI002FF8B777
MIERVVKSATAKALDPDEFISSQPLNFQLYYANKDGRSEIINTVYLEDGNPKLDLYLEVFNESDEEIRFQTSAGKLSTVEAGGNSSASANKCHFSLRWEKDLQIEPSEISVEPAEWQVNYDEDSHFFTLYFLHKSGFVLKPQNSDSDNKSDRVLLTLKNFTANNRAVKSTNVELLYGSGLLLNGGEHFTETLSIKNTISVTNHPDNKNIPLQFRFIGPNTILNDGTTPNSLNLQIINRPPSNNNRPNLLLDKTNSKFIVSFETGDSAEALTTSTIANKVIITSADTNNWKVDPTQNAAEWTVKLNESSKKDKLTSKEAIELNISNLVTGNASGVAYLYITYQNIGGYPDGQLVVPIEKTPFLYRGAQVGIGTTTPAKQLHVVGDLVLGKNDANKKFIFHSRTGNTENNDFLQITSDKSDGQWEWEQGITLKRNGYVGIGTNSPSAKLHVSGGDAIVIGKVGIGTTTPAAKLHVNGNIRLSGQIEGGSDKKLSIYSNTNSTDSRAWIEMWDNSASDRTGELTLTGNCIDFRYGSTTSAMGTTGMRLTSDGKVGIGITTPSDKVHIKDGNLRIDTGSIKSWGTIAFHANTDQSANEDLIKVLKSNGTDVAMLVAHQGNVGIGTTNPSAKLHVDGGDAIISGKLAIRTTNPTIDLAIGDYDTGLKQQGDGKLAICTDGHERVRIEKNGNVGIGTTDPKQKLHVEGRIRLSDVPVWNGGGGCDVTWVANNYDGAHENEHRWNCIAREGSSERYKQNIAPLEDDFQKLLSLQPKQYQMKEGYGDPNTWDFGYLAEDLDKIGLKSLVIYNQSGQPDGIQYKKMCIYLNEVVKSQQSSMERLEEKVNELNEKLISSL